MPTNLPETVKQEFLQDSLPRYIWVALPEPIQQIGHDFSFIVLPVKLTLDLALEQCGQGVLCQTEAEMKESMELLSEKAKKPIVLVQSAGFGIVGKITNFRSFITEQSVRYRVGKNGEREWWVLEREIDKATGEVTVLRRQDAANEEGATLVAKQWLQEYEQKEKKYFDAIAKSNTPPPPPRCTPLTQIELKDDLPAAKWTALKRKWPHSFEIFERERTNPRTKISHQECQDAYLLDLVEHGYDPKAETIRGDLKLAEALTKAAKKYARSGKRKITDLAIYFIAFNWELGWCYLSDAEIATKLGASLKARFTSGQVKQYRLRELGLVAKHLPGPAPKSP
ncbi:MAG: hypothetical protein WDN00_00035 [Limisphaerales bacterium]